MMFVTALVSGVVGGFRSALYHSALYHSALYHSAGSGVDTFDADNQVSIHRAARNLSIPPTRLVDLVHDRRAITPDTALALGRLFSATVKLGLNLQIK